MDDIEPVSPEQVEDYVMRRLSLRQLRVLKALGETSSLSAAADSLHVTQPAVSKTLGELEACVGRQLFHRRGRNFLPTELGLRLIDLCHRMEILLKRGSEESAALTRGALGELSIGATNAAMTDVVVTAVARLKTESPYLNISFRTTSLTSMHEDLRKGRFDLVFCREAGERPNDLHAQWVLSTQEVVAISTCHPLVTHRYLSWEELNEQAWLLPVTGTTSRTRRDEFWRKQGLPLPKNILQTDSLSLSLNLLRRMPLVTILPEHIAKSFAFSGILKMLPLPIDLGMGDLFAWHVKGVQNPAVERLKVNLRQALDVI